MLIIRVITFELVQSAHGTSTLQTDGRTTYDSNTALALRASRGKNLVVSLHVPEIQLEIVHVSRLCKRTDLI